MRIPHLKAFLALLAPQINPAPVTSQGLDLELLLSEAAHDDPRALFQLGHIYEHGLLGQGRSLQTAEVYYLRAAATEAPLYSGMACSRLGLIYSQDDTIAADPVLALMWYSLALSRGQKEVKPQLKSLMAKLDQARLATAYGLVEQWDRIKALGVFRLSYVRGLVEVCP